MTGSNRSHFWSALAGGLVVAVVMAALPAVAANGDTMIVGAKNNASRTTKLISRGGLLVRSGEPGSTPLTLVSLSGTPPMAVSGSAKVKHLNADMVDGRSANSLMRGGFCAEDNAADFTDYSCTMNITAPRPGYLFMSGSVDLYMTADGGDLLHCVYEVDGTQVIGSLQEIDMARPGHGEVNCTTDAGVYVAAGAHTVTFKMNSVGLTTRLADVGAYAFYVPFDGSGLIPAAP